jgi:GTPase Era involved in 16S rRNA processing
VASDEPIVTEFILQSIPKLEAAVDADVVAIVGASDSGKSALVNYMLNTAMEIREIGAQDRAVTKDPRQERAKIGNRAQSTTMLTAVYRNHQDASLKHLAICDCPGIKDTRSGTERRLTEINTQLLLKAAKSVKLVFAISHGTLFDNNGTHFREAIHSLVALFQCRNMTKLADSIVFAITKVDACRRIPTIDKVKLQVADLLAARRAVCASASTSVRTWFQKVKDKLKLKRDDDVLTAEQQAELAKHYGHDLETIHKQQVDIANDTATIAILEAMLAKPERIVIVDYQDAACVARSSIFDCIEQVSALSKAEFEVDKHDNLRVWFQSRMHNIARSGVQQFQEWEQYKQLSLELQEANAQVSSAQTWVTQTETSAYQAQYTLYWGALKQSQDLYVQYQTELAGVTSRIAQIDVDDVSVCWRKEFRGDSFWSFVFPGASQVIDCTSDLKGSQIEDVMCDAPAGRIDTLEKDLKRGVYRGEYHKGWFTTADALVEVLVKERNKPGNPELLRQLRAKQCWLQQRLHETAKAERQQQQRLQQINQQQMQQKHFQSLFDAARNNQTTAQARFDAVVAFKPSLQWRALLERLAVATACRILDSDSNLIKAFVTGCERWLALPAAGVRTSLLHQVQSIPFVSGNTQHDLVKALCDAGADLRAVDQAGDAPLHIAIRNGSVDVALELALRGCNGEQKNGKGFSPMQLLFSHAEHDTLVKKKNFPRLAAALGLRGGFSDIPKDYNPKVQAQIIAIYEKAIGDNKDLNKSVPQILTDALVSSLSHIAFDSKAHEQAFTALFDIPELAPLLELASFAVLGLHANPANSNRLRIFVSPESACVDDLSMYEDERNAFGVCYLEENKILLGGKRVASAVDGVQPEQLLAGTLIHELTHFIANDMFHNSARPYAGKTQAQQKFAVVREDAKKSTHPLIQAAFTEPYTPEQTDAELIVRIPQLIAWKMGVTNLAQKAAPLLYQHFVEEFLPLCREHLATLQLKHLLLPLEREPARSVALLDM